MLERIGTISLIVVSSLVVLLQTSPAWASGLPGYALSGALFAFGVGLLVFLKKHSP